MGRAILTAKPWGDARYTVSSRDENKQELIRRRFPEVQTVLCDIRDRDRLDVLVRGMDLVIHMAALKHIDEAEFNISETVAVNIVGTENVLRACAWAGVPSVVFISTDKATAPLNSYGSSKQLGERLIGEYARKWSNTRFTATRFGNVVGSTGSVTWKWYQAIREGGVVTMTDPRMTRFWMAPHEAVAVIERATHMPSGTVTIPMCAAMAMGDVAEAMGARKLQTIGLRPGERMDEMLLSPEEAPRAIVDGEHILLRPAYEDGRASSVTGYTSRTPLRWVEAEELRAMINEAKELW